MITETDLNKLTLAQHSLKLCHAIESAGASPQLTQCTIIASHLLCRIESIPPSANDRKEELEGEYKSLAKAAREVDAPSVSASGAELIAAERHRQISEEGWSIAHDSIRHLEGELTSAAICYAKNSPEDWPWEMQRWKPSDDPMRNLVKAGALIAAEIDRAKNVEQVGGALMRFQDGN